MRKSMLEHSWSWILFEGDLAEALSNAPEHILQELGPAMTDAHILRVLPNLSSNFSDIEMSRLLGSLSLPVAVSARLQDYDEPLPRRAAYAYDAAWTLGLALAAAHDQQLGGSMQARILGHSRIPQISFAGASCSSEASSADMNAFSAGHSVEALVVREGREFAWMKAERIPGDAGSQLEIRTNEMLHATRRKGSDQAVSAGGSDCRMGTVFEPKGRVCAYHVALIFPCKSRHFPPSRALAAYLAVSHVNSRNGEIVGPVTAGSLGETLRIQPLLLCHDDSPSSSMEAGLSAYSTPVIAAVGGGSSQATMTILQLMEISNTPVVSYGSSSKPLSSFLMSSHLSISDEHQAVQAAKLAMESFGWCRIGVIHEDNMVGSSFFSAFKHACKWLASLRQTQASEFEVGLHAQTSANHENHENESRCASYWCTCVCRS